MSRQSALITGASRGIGLGIATRLAQRGYALTIAARDPDRLEVGRRSELRDAGAPEVPGGGRGHRERGLPRTISSVRMLPRFGKVDVLVLNAGVGSAGALADFHPRRFDKQITLNLRAPFVLLQQALPLLRKAAAGRPGARRQGDRARLDHRRYAEPELAVYGATKAALMSLVRSVNREEAERGVCATAICAGVRRHRHGGLRPRADPRRGRCSR